MRKVALRDEFRRCAEAAKVNFGYKEIYVLRKDALRDEFRRCAEAAKVKT